jgi:hypothetical protein
MSEQGSGQQSRWWRRGRDQAQQAARAAHGVAAEAMMTLDAELRDVPTLISAHEDLVAARRHKNRPVEKTALSLEWAELSSMADEAIGCFLEPLGRFDPKADLEEAQALRFQTEFTHAAHAMTDLVLPRVRQFLARFDTELSAARSLTVSAPHKFNAAVAALNSAQQALTSAESSLVAAMEHATAAEEAMKSRQWTEAGRRSDAASAIAQDVLTRAQAIPQRVQDVKNKVMSLRTRKEALETQHSRLHPLMSQLRREFTYGSWQHIADVPGRAEKDLAVVTEGLAELDRMLAVNPLDVSAIEVRVREVRAAAKAIGEYVEAAQELLHKLKAVAADPEVVLGPVRRNAVDVRRFIDRLSPDARQRYSLPYDGLARRIDALASSTKVVNPDWGKVLEEAEQITMNLDLLVRTARS